MLRGEQHLRTENRIVEGGQVPDIETIDSELRLVAALRRAARELGGPLPSVDAAEAPLDERRELAGLPRVTRYLGNY